MSERDLELYMDDCEIKQGFKYDSKQRDILRHINKRSNLNILNGYAGTGKTTTTLSARRSPVAALRPALSVGGKCLPAPTPSPVHRSAPPSAERRTSIVQTQNDVAGARKNWSKTKLKRRLCHANQNLEISLRLL